MASIFIPEGVIVTTRGRTQPTMTLSAAGNAISTSIPLVVLVDGDTASASEIVTGALQDHRRAVVVGTRTFGKGVFQEVKPLSNGGALDITVGQYFTPNGRNLGGGGVSQGAGSRPDVMRPASQVDRPAGELMALRSRLAWRRLKCTDPGFPRPGAVVARAAQARPLPGGRPAVSRSSRWEDPPPREPDGGRAWC